MNIKTEPTKQAMAWRGHSSMENIMQTFKEKAPQVYQHILSNGGQIAGPMYGRYHHFTQTDMDLEIGVFVKEPVAGTGDIQPVEIPGGQVTSQDYYGPYSGVPGAWNAAHQWFSESKEWEISGPPMEVYWTDPGEEPDQSKWRTEIVHPVRRKG